MEKSILLGNRHPFSQLLILVGICLVSVAVFSFVPFLLAKPLFGIDGMQAANLFTGSNSPNEVALLKFMQLMQSLGFFVVPPLIFARLYGHQLRSYLSLQLPAKSIQWPIMVLLMLGAVPLINWLGELNAQLHLPEWLASTERWMKEMESEAEQLTKTFLVMNSVGALCFNLLLIALIPAIGEELLFRGALQNVLFDWTKNKHAAIWISAILFSALHLQFYGFIPRMLLGAMLGYTLVWTGSLWIPILGHFVNNGTAVLLSFLQQRNIVSSDVEHIGESSYSYLWLVLSLAIVGSLLYLLKRQSRVISN